MKRILTLLLLIPVLMIGQQPEELVHSKTLYVDDYADIFSQDEEKALDQKIRTFFDTVQISIVTVKSLNGIASQEYATRLGRAWGVGGQSNNGLLILVGVDDHKLFTATGYGVEGDLPDIKIKDLQDEYAIPSFKDKEYYPGIKKLLDAYINELSPSAKELRVKEEQVRKERAAAAWQNTKEVLLYIIMFLGVAALIGLPFYIRWRRERKKREEEQKKEALIIQLEAAKKFLKQYPVIEPHGETYNKSPYYANKYIEQRKNIEANANNGNLIEYAALIFLASSSYNSIFRTPESYTNTEARKRITHDDYVPPSRSKSSDDDYISSGSSDNSNDSSSSPPSSDFGGGSFGGGGSESNW